jgi:hypothetical protein
MPIASDGPGSDGVEVDHPTPQGKRALQPGIIGCGEEVEPLRVLVEADVYSVIDGVVAVDVQVLCRTQGGPVDGVFRI